MLKSYFKWGRARTIDELEQKLGEMQQSGDWQSIILAIEDQKTRDWPSAGHKKLNALLARAYSECFAERLGQAQELLEHYFDSESLDRYLREARRLAEQLQQDLEVPGRLAVLPEQRRAFERLRGHLADAQTCVPLVQKCRQHLQSGDLEAAQEAQEAMEGKYPTQRLAKLRRHWHDQKNQARREYAQAEESLRRGDLEECRAALARGVQLWRTFGRAAEWRTWLEAATELRACCLRVQEVPRGEPETRYRLWSEAQEQAEKLPPDLRRLYEGDESIEIQVYRVRESWIAALVQEADSTCRLETRIALLGRILDLDGEHRCRSARDALRQILATLEAAVRTCREAIDRDLPRSAAALEAVEAETDLEYPPLHECRRQVQERVEYAGQRAVRRAAAGELDRALQQVNALPPAWAGDYRRLGEQWQRRMDEADELVAQMGRELDREEADAARLKEMLEHIAALYRGHPQLEALRGRWQVLERAQRRAAEAEQWMRPDTYGQAVALFEEAAALRSSAQLEQRLAEARRLAEKDQIHQRIETLVREAEELAREKQLGAALAKYDEILSLNPAAESARAAREVLAEQVETACRLEARAEKAPLEEALAVLIQSRELWPRSELKEKIARLERLQRALSLRQKAEEEIAFNNYAARDLLRQALAQCPAPETGPLPSDLVDFPARLEEQIAALSTTIQREGIKGPVRFNRAGHPPLVVLPICAYASPPIVGHADCGTDARGNKALSFRAGDISPAHMRFIWQPGGRYYGSDISRSGVFVNGERQRLNRSFALEAGDELRLGARLSFAILMQGDSCLLEYSGPAGDDTPVPGLRLVLLGTRFALEEDLVLLYDHERRGLYLETSGDERLLTEGEIASGLVACQDLNCG